jgi:hypothetical protein
MAKGLPPTRSRLDKARQPGTLIRPRQDPQRTRFFSFVLPAVAGSGPQGTDEAEAVRILRALPDRLQQVAVQML